MLSLAIFIDRIDSVSASGKRPGVLFRPPEHPGVLVEPSTNAPLQKGYLNVQRGKSCILVWPESSTSLSLELYLVDVIDAPAEGRGVLLGAAVHSLKIDDKHVRAFHIRLREVIGNSVWTLHCLCRCQRLGEALVPHLMHEAAQIKRQPRTPQLAAAARTAARTASGPPPPPPAVPLIRKPAAAPAAALPPSGPAPRRSRSLLRRRQSRRHLHLHPPSRRWRRKPLYLPSLSPLQSPRRINTRSRNSKARPLYTFIAARTTAWPRASRLRTTVL